MYTPCQFKISESFANSQDNAIITNNVGHLTYGKF